MKNLKQFGGLSFGTEEAYDNFLSLPKDEQIKQVANSLSPKDSDLAAKILKGVRNGDSSGVQQEDKSDNASNVAGRNGGHNSKQSKADKAGEA